MKTSTACFLLFFMLQSGVSDAASYPDPRSNVGEQFLIDARNKSLSGDFEASYWLSMYYIDGISDVREGEFWLRLAAEQNFCVAQQDYSRFIKSVSERKHQYWQDRMKSCVGAREWRN